MNTRYLYLITHVLLLGLGLAFSSAGHAQFDRVLVRLQTGKDVPLDTLPWFKLNLSLQDSRFKDRASSADWVVYSPPKFCPFSSFYYVRWEGRLTEAERHETKQKCDARQKEKLFDLTPTEQSVCECKVVLETLTQASSGVAEKAVWKSLDDELLLGDEMKLPFSLKRGTDVTPILVSLGGQNPGLYSFAGERLCSYTVPRSSEQESPLALGSAYETLNHLFRFGDKPLPINCLGNQMGTLLLNELSFSLLRRRIVGTGYLEFPNGEKYELDPRQ